MKKLIVIIVIGLSLCGCKKEPEDRVLIFGRKQSINFKTGLKIEEDEDTWIECQILEKKNGMWKVKAIEKGLTHPIEWIDPKEKTYKAI